MVLLCGYEMNHALTLPVDHIRKKTALGVDDDVEVPRLILDAVQLNIFCSEKRNVKFIPARQCNTVFAHRPSLPHALISSCWTRRQRQRYVLRRGIEEDNRYETRDGRVSQRAKNGAVKLILICSVRIVRAARHRFMASHKSVQ